MWDTQSKQTINGSYHTIIKSMNGEKKQQSITNLQRKLFADKGLKCDTRDQK